LLLPSAPVVISGAGRQSPDRPGVAAWYLTLLFGAGAKSYSFISFFWRRSRDPRQPRSPLW